MSLGEINESVLEVVKEAPLGKKDKRSIFRLPHNSVEKLRHVFAENELPVRAVRESLSKQLGLELEKVNKWFKNARYLALKVRKAERSKLSEDAGSIQNKTVFEIASDENADKIAREDNRTSQMIKTFKRYSRRRNNYLLTNSLMKKKRKQSLKPPDTRKTPADFGDDESLKHLRERAKQAKKKLNIKNRDDMLEAEAKMERLCQIRSRVEKLRQSLPQLPCQKVCKNQCNYFK